jgi:uncharacterized damage-inducible protein DinB
MLASLQPVWKRWRETHDALLDCLEQFPEDRLHWQPAPTATTAARILVHIARGETVYASLIDPAAAGPPELSYPGGDEAAAAQRRAELVASVTGREAAGRLINAAADFATRVAEGLREEDLERVLADDWNPLGPPVEGPLTVCWFLEQMNRHKAYHLGQLWYISMLAEGEGGEQP